VLGGCSTGSYLVAASSDAITRMRIADWLEQHPLPADQNIKAELLGRSESLSYHIVQIRNREQPHMHATHDLSVTLVHGEGSLFVRDTPLAMRSGDVAIVPRGTPHYFVNQGSEPAVAFVTFAPPSDGSDNVPLRSAGSPPASP
jgi:mannose-6-phosphate isomerase-like protein (cupin superfamily)